MGGKGKGKSKKKTQAPKARQQPEAAAGRHVTASGPEGRARPAAPQTETLASAAPVRVSLAAAVPEATAAQPATRRYVDVAAVRIQDWLGRTPDLKFRRGASVLLTEATAPETWRETLPVGVRLNEEAGNVDGVISLALDDSADPEHAAKTVAEHMRATMPQCPIQAVHAEGDSYATAYPAMARARRDGNFLLDFPPVPPEVILAKPCDQCRSTAATEPGIKVSPDGERNDLCRECLARFDAAGRTAGTVRQAPLPERRMRRAVEEAGMTVKGFSDGFDDLARAGQHDPGDAASQIAVIYADGNRVGAFLSKAASVRGGPDKATIAPLLHEATLGALAAAVVNRFSGWQRIPALAHIAGGDDLLISVPAPDAWLFTHTLLKAFGQRIREATGGWPSEIGKDLPSLSAGIVFHHATAPFSDVVRLADQQLALAKRKERGQSAVAFLDLTADGNAPPEGREPLPLGYLDEHAGRLRQVAELPASRRATLLDYYRDSAAVEEFIDRLTDFADNKPLWQIASGPHASAPDVRRDLVADVGKRAEVRRALDIARYWTAEPREENREENKGDA